MATAVQETFEPAIDPLDVSRAELYRDDVWQEPFVALRLPKLFNLRSDPFETAIIRMPACDDGRSRGAKRPIWATVDSGIIAPSTVGTSTVGTCEASASQAWSSPASAPEIAMATTVTRVVEMPA